MKSLSELVTLEGKSCILTGAANGIGAAIAKRFAQAGAHLHLIDIDTDKLTSLKKELEVFGTEISTHEIDLGAKNNIDRFWSEMGGQSPDILVNNAGIFPFIKFLDLSEAALKKVMEVNLFSVLWMCQAFIKRRLKKGGIIVNFSSIEAILPFKKDLTHYSISKIGVLTLTRDLAREYAGKNIRINGILPGGILTKGTRDASIKALTSFNTGLLKDGYNFKQRVPAGRMGKPDDVAKMTLVLCSDLASYVHGAIIPVDGGFLSA